MEASSRLHEPQGSPEPDRLETLWNRIQERLRASIRREQYETWFRRTALASADERVLDEGSDERRLVEVVVHNGFTRDWLTTYYADVLQRAVDEVLGAPCNIQYVVDPERLPARSPLPQEAPPAPPEPPAAAPAGAAEDPSRVQLWATDDPERFARVGGRFLDMPLRADAVRVVDL